MPKKNRQEKESKKERKKRRKENQSLLLKNQNQYQKDKRKREMHFPLSNPTYQPTNQRSNSKTHKIFIKRKMEKKKKNPPGFWSNITNTSRASANRRWKMGIQVMHDKWAYLNWISVQITISHQSRKPHYNITSI